MSILKEKLAKKVPELREHYRKLVKENGAVKLSEVTIETLYGGLRGVKGLICDTSSVPPDKGLLVRGIPIGELAERLPEEIWYLLLLGELSLLLLDLGLSLLDVPLLQLNEGLTLGKRLSGLGLEIFNYL